MSDITSEKPNEEPIEEEEEEEEHYEDNTQYRDDILQSQPKTYDEWINYINNLQINVPEVPDVDFTDENDIFAHIPVIIDACKYIYNTRNYRFESYAKAANELYTEYKENFQNIENGYSGLFTDIDSKYIEKINEINNNELLTPEEKQEQLAEIEEQKQNDITNTITNKENDILTLNTDYMNKCYVLVQKVQDVKNQTKTETGFIGDVYIEGNLNNHPVSEYVLRSELTTGEDGNITINLDDYAKKEDLDKYALKEHTHDEYIKKDDINECFKQYEFYLLKMEDKLNLKLDKSTFGFSDDETVINKLFYYNHKCNSLEEQSNSIAVKILPLVNDDQVYFVYGYLYVKNYWNSEVIYKIEAKVKNTTVEVNTVDIIRSNGTHWNPLENLHKITVGEKSFAGVVINAEDAYNWSVYFSGYFNDINLCKIVKENEYTDDLTFDLVNYSTVKTELNDKITSEISSVNESITDIKTELNDKISTDINTINENITNIKEELDTKITGDIDTINETLASKSDINHNHDDIYAKKDHYHEQPDSLFFPVGKKQLRIDGDGITLREAATYNDLFIKPENIEFSNSKTEQSVSITPDSIKINDVPVRLTNQKITFDDIEVEDTIEYGVYCFYTVSKKILLS